MLYWLGVNIKFAFLLLIPFFQFQSQATPVRFSRGQFSRMRPAENEKIACESERECSTVVTEPCSEEKKIVVRDNGKRAEVLRNQNTEAVRLGCVLPDVITLRCHC